MEHEVVTTLLPVVVGGLIGIAGGWFGPSKVCSESASHQELIWLVLCGQKKLLVLEGLYWSGHVLGCRLPCRSL